MRTRTIRPAKRQRNGRAASDDLARVEGYSLSRNIRLLLALTRLPDTAALLVVHPIVALIDLAYLVAFVRRQARSAKWAAMALALPSMAGFLAFRVLLFK